MKVIDLTHTIWEGMPVYPGTEEPRLTLANTYEQDGFQETLLCMTSHTGTHMDPPFHLFSDRTTLDSFGAEQFVGRAVVIDCRELRAGERIPLSLVKKNPLAGQAEFLLFCTGWDRYWGEKEYFGEYPCIDREVAQYLLDSGKKGIGLDTIGLDPIRDVNLTLHKQLLSQGEIVIIENLTNLDRVGEGLFTLCALPLKYRQADGAPVRAVAILEK